MRDKKGGQDWLLKIILTPVFVLGGVLAWGSAVFAYTEISADTVWTKAQNPIIVQDSVWVKPGVTLTIEPGVVVKLKENQSILTAGILKATGSDTDPIIFTSYKDDEYGGDSNGDGNASAPNAGDWYFINIYNGGKGVLDNVIIKHGGIWKSGGNSYYTSAINSFKGNISIANSVITNNGGGINNSQGYIKISNSSIYNNLQPFWKGEFFDVALINNAGSGGSVAIAVNNWWGTSEGLCVFRDYMPPPGVPVPKDFNLRALCGNRPLVDWGVTYDPWLQSEPTKKKNPNPVIIIPGILGSYLNKNEPGLPEVWPNADRMLLPGGDDYLNELALTTIGWPDFSDNLIATDAIRKILTSDFWDGLVKELENNGYEEGENLFVFPYDWRLDINWIAGESPLPNHPGLKEKIEEVKNLTGADKVDIVAHSMGGLVAKKYFQKYGNASLGKFIDIATPHLGAPKAFKALMYGDDMDKKFFGGPSILNPDRIKFISQNMPSIYQLLPSREYFNISDQNYKNYVVDIHDFDGNNVKGNLNYDQAVDFMKNTGRNAGLLALSDNLHKEIDNLAVPNTFNIIGCGEPTIGKIFVLNKEKSGGYEYALNYISGNATVPLRSAEAIDSAKIYIKGSEHSGIPSAYGVKQLAGSILKGEQDNFNFSNYQNLSLDKRICSLSGMAVSYHSPIELHVYDENNNHLGPNENGDIEMGIGGASYDIIEENKFAFLPIGHSYRVVGKATTGGFFNARIETIEDGVYKETVYYNEIPLQSASTTIQLNVNYGQNNYSMSVDNDGDGQFEKEIAPSSILNEEEAADLVKPETAINISTPTGLNGWHASDANIVLVANDNEEGSGILKTEYSIDYGGTWVNYAEPFTISREGETKILYSSTDRAGNREDPKKAVIKIDKTGPVIDFIVPFGGEEFLRSENFLIEYEAMDNFSGVATSAEEVFLDGIKINLSEPVDLFNLSLGEHELKINLSDSAGNVSVKQIKFKVIANIESAISDIERSYNEGFIEKEQAKDKLIKELEWIREFTEKHGEKEEKMDKKISEKINKCQKIKNKERCEERIKKHTQTINYALDKVYEKIVLAKYENILKELNIYHKKEWINNRGYGIIKEDIEYLIVIRISPGVSPWKLTK